MTMTAAPCIEVVRLYVSPGHNFFGHHDQPAGRHPIEVRPEIECVAGRGIRGDRFFDYKPDYKGQITFFAWETYEALCGAFPGVRADPGAFRRNVITRGVDLNELADREFEVQGVRFRGAGESAPCHWMNGAFAPGAEEALRGRGGLRARILTDGILRVAGPAA